MDADSIQREVRESMTLPMSEIDAINLRLVKHMQCRNFNVPMLRLVSYPSTGEWACVPNIHAFYNTFRHVVRFREKKIDDAALSLAVSASRTWHVYTVGMLSYLKMRGLVWIATRTRLVLTPYGKGETAETVAAASFISRLLDPASKPPSISGKGEVRLRKCDIEVFEFLIRVDLGLSHLNTLWMDSHSGLTPVHARKDADDDDDDDDDVLVDSDIDDEGDDVPYTIGYDGEQQSASWTPLSHGHAKSLPVLPSMSSLHGDMDLAPQPAKKSEPANLPDRAVTPSSTAHHARSVSMPVKATIPEGTAHEQSEKKPAAVTSPRQTGQSYVQVRRTGSGTSGGKKQSTSQKPKNKKTSDNLEYLAIYQNIAKKHGGSSGSSSHKNDEDADDVQ